MVELLTLIATAIAKLFLSADQQEGKKEGSGVPFGAMSTNSGRSRRKPPRSGQWLRLRSPMEWNEKAIRQFGTPNCAAISPSQLERQGSGRTGKSFR